jgi:hypothetical protein
VSGLPEFGSVLFCRNVFGFIDESEKIKKNLISIIFAISKGACLYSRMEGPVAVAEELMEEVLVLGTLNQDVPDDFTCSLLPQWFKLRRARNVQWQES